MTKFIYLIQSLEDGYYKIGVSKNPNKRVSQLSTGNSSPLKLIESYRTDYPYLIEKSLQRRYEHLRKEGEWFNLSVREETSFLTDCKIIENNITFLKNKDNVFI